MTKYILVIGDEVAYSASEKDELIPKYNSKLKEYNDSGGRPSKRPTIWKLVKFPNT